MHLCVAACALPGPSLHLSRTPRDHKLLINRMNTCRLHYQDMDKLDKAQAETAAEAAITPCVDPQASLVGASDRLDMCFNTVTRITSIAREAGCARSHVRACMMSTALCLAMTYSMVFDAIVASQHSLRLVWDKIKFDDAGQKMSFDMHADLARDQRLSTWDIMVQFRWIGWILPCGKKWAMAIPMFPSVCVGHKSSGCVWDALFGGTWAKKVMWFVGELRKLAKRAMAFRESDKASQCEAVLVHEMRQNPRVLYSKHFCNLHQQCIGVGTLTKMYYATLVAAQYGYACLLRMGNFWLRTLIAIDVMLDVNFRVKKKKPCLDLSPTVCPPYTTLNQ